MSTDDLPDLLRLQLDRHETARRTADEAAHAAGLAAFFPASYVTQARKSAERAAEAYERGERGLA